MNAIRDKETRTYRGRSLEEVLPKIKADLGPDAVIVRQRDGLMGGVGGFFQRQCIEVDATGPEGDASPQTVDRGPQNGSRFDAYDAEESVAPDRQDDPSQGLSLETFVPDPLADPDTAEGLAAPAIQEMLRQAAPFADQLSAAGAPSDEDEQPAAAPLPAPAYAAVRPSEPSLPLSVRGPGRGRPPVADAVETALKDAGLGSELAAAVVSETVTHRLPFATPRAFKRLVREGIASRIPVVPVAPGRGRSIAFAGPGGSGKTLCTARLAAAYAAGSDLPVICIALRAADDGAELARLLEPHGVAVHAASSGDEARAHVAGAMSHALVVVDTPAVAPGSQAEVAALATELAALGLDEVHVTVPCTFSGPAAQELLERLAPLGPSRLALTHADATNRIGPLLDYVIGERVPISYLSSGAALPGGLEPADAASIAAMVLP